MRREPHDHYAAAEDELSAAHKARVVAEDERNTIPNRNNAFRDLEIHLKLADLHRRMAETGLAFVEAERDTYPAMTVDPGAEPVEAQEPEDDPPPPIGIGPSEDHRLLIWGVKKHEDGYTALVFHGKCACERGMGEGREAPESITERWMHHLQDVRRTRKSEIGWGT